MKLSKGDISRLYGEHIFIISDKDGTSTKPEIETPIEAKEPEKQEEAPKTPAQEVVNEPVPLPEIPKPKDLQSGNPIQWKMRAGATLALVLTQAEFHNKFVTNGLKQLVLDAGVNPKEIGFGIMDGEGEAWDFSDMPVPVAVVFNAIPVKKTPVKIPSGTIHISYPVNEIVMDPNKQQVLLKLFKHINQ